MPQTLTGLGPDFTTAPFLEKCGHRSAAARGQRLEFTDSASFNGQREFLFHDTYLIAGARVVKMVAEAAENRRRRESWQAAVVSRQTSGQPRCGVRMSEAGVLRTYPDFRYQTTSRLKTLGEDNSPHSVESKRNCGK